jgi:hypothetical protein
MASIESGGNQQFSVSKNEPPEGVADRANGKPSSCG